MCMSYIVGVCKYGVRGWVWLVLAVTVFARVAECVPSCPVV